MIENVVLIDGDGSDIESLRNPEWRGPLAHFIAINEGQVDEAELRADIERDRFHRIGGGAAAEFTVLDEAGFDEYVAISEELEREIYDGPSDVGCRARGGGGVTMLDVTKISDEMIEGAACEDDLDAALKPLMDAAGITSGDVAAQCFSGVHWAGLDVVRRLRALEDWLVVEQG